MSPAIGAKRLRNDFAEVRVRLPRRLADLEGACLPRSRTGGRFFAPVRHGRVAALWTRAAGRPFPVMRDWVTRQIHA